MARLVGVLLTALLLWAFAAREACADTPPPEPDGRDWKRCVKLSFDGYLQVWGLVHEETENGLLQPWTGDAAADTTSGFLVRRARLAANVTTPWVRGRLELGLEGSVRLLDAWAAAPFFGGKLEPWIGQMKVPATYEVETPSSDLDFATRSAFSARVVDWTLCRSPANASPFYGVRTYLRDLGIALKGKVGGLSYFLMVGNGLGTNLYVGGGEHKQYLYTNDPGAYLYGGRVSYDVARHLRRTSWARWLCLCEVGGHYCRNRHPNVVFNDERNVFDIDRWSWSADCRIDVLDRVRLTGMVGAGAVEDDFDHDGRRDFEYRGWEAKVVVTVVRDRLECGFRYDVYETEHFQNGSVDSLATATVGLTYTPWPVLRLQLNYVWHDLTSPTDPDLDDDLLLLVVQLHF